MLPKWFDVNEIPYDSMWADDKHWFPLFLEINCFKGFFSFKSDEKSIINHNLEVVDIFE